MKSKSKELKKHASAKVAALGGVLQTTEKIKETVTEAATELTSVNETLRQDNVPDQVIKTALTQNEDVELKVAKAADDLKLVNDTLAKEVAERIVIEKELKNPASAKVASLDGVLKKTEKIKETVTEAANELTSVNEALRQDNVPPQVIKTALTQNEGVELKVAKAAEHLKLVNATLAKEVAERKVIESQLADTQSDLAGVRDDLSKSQAKEEEAQQLALQDPLTGLPNRLSFVQRLDHALTQAKRHRRKLAVLFIDIDKFKIINDSHGHDLGDQVLVMVAKRLQSSVRDGDMVSRWGGDEFVCLLLEVKQDADVTRLAEKMINRIAEACEFNEISLSIRASIGIAIYPADGETADILFKNADSAMYKAKETKMGVCPSDI